MTKVRIPIRISSSGLRELNSAIVPAVKFRTPREYIGLTGMDFGMSDLIPM